MECAGFLAFVDLTSAAVGGAVLTRAGEFAVLIFTAPQTQTRGRRWLRDPASV